MHLSFKKEKFAYKILNNQCQTFIRGYFKILLKFHNFSFKVNKFQLRR